MDVPCPECDEPLELLDGDEMGSAPRGYRCLDCELIFERDASGLLVEVDLERLAGPDTADDWREPPGSAQSRCSPGQVQE